MSTFYPEDQWNNRATSLRKARAARYGKKAAKREDPVLRKAKALERLRVGGERSPLSKYDVVPPLKPKTKAFERTSADDDSWGEGTDDSDIEDYVPRQKGQVLQQPNYPLPPMSFALVPVQYPGSLGYVQSPPKQAKRKDYLRRKPRQSYETKKNKGRPLVGVSIETQTDNEPSIVGYDIKHRGLEDLYRSTPSPVSRYISPARNDPRYKYIHVAPPRGLVSDDDRVLDEASQRFSNDPLFAERYVEEFISTELQNEIIPDLLIDAMGDLSRQKPGFPKPSLRPAHIMPPTYAAAVSKKPAPDMGTSLQPSLVYRREGIHGLEKNLVSQADLSIDIMEDMISDFVRQHAAAVVRETCSEYVNSHLSKGKSYVTMDNMMDKLTAETTRSLFDEVMREVSEELSLEQDVINPTVDSLLIDLATESLLEQDELLKGKQSQQLSKDADKKLLDGMMLDYLLEQIVRPDKMYQQFDSADGYCLDGMMLDVMLRKLAQIEASQSSGLEVKPVRRYHERLVTDVVTELLLNELCLNLDEDVKDYDEYETGLSEYLITNGHYGARQCPNST